MPGDLKITTDDSDAARKDQGYLGPFWFVIEDYAVAQVHERPLLVKALQAEGYELVEPQTYVRQPKKPDRRSGDLRRAERLIQDRRATRRRTDDKRKAKLRVR